MSEPANDIVSKLGSAMNAADRFRAMSNRELVAECLNSEASEYLVVIEMMNRLDPMWANRPEPSSMRIANP